MDGSGIVGLSDAQSPVQPKEGIVQDISARVLRDGEEQLAAADLAAAEPKTQR